MFGSLGGAGAYAFVNLANSAWLRIGLFGGGWRVDLDNRVEAAAYLFTTELVLFRAALEFGMVHTYRNDVPDDVVALAQSVEEASQDLGAVFASAKALVTERLAAFAGYTAQIKLAFTSMLGGLSDELLTKLTVDLPKLVGDSAFVVSAVSWLTTMSRKVRPTGLQTPPPPPNRLIR